MRRTTINVDPELLRQAKHLAAQTGRTLTAVIEDALRESLTRRDRDERQTVILPTFTGSGVQPGVDLDSAAALLDIMEQPDADARR